MAKASDNPFPSVLVVEGTVPASPASGDQRVYIDSADHKLKRVDSAGAITTIEGGTGGDLTKISEVVLASSAASISFTSIPATYRQLKLVGQVRGDNAAAQDLFMQFNGDTATANYDRARIYEAAAGSTAGGYASGSSLGMYIGYLVGSGGDAGHASSFDALIPHYRSAFWKNSFARSSFMPSTTAAGWNFENFLGQWHSTAVINQIDIKPATGNFVAGSIVSLYGES